LQNTAKFIKKNAHNQIKFLLIKNQTYQDGSGKIIRPISRGENAIQTAKKQAISLQNHYPAGRIVVQSRT